MKTFVSTEDADSGRGPALGSGEVVLPAAGTSAAWGGRTCRQCSQRRRGFPSCITEERTDAHEVFPDRTAAPQPLQHQ